MKKNREKSANSSITFKSPIDFTEDNNNFTQKFIFNLYFLLYPFKRIIII